MSDSEKKRPSYWVLGLCGFALLAFIAGAGCMIWAKNTGTPLVADEPYLWDGTTNIMVVYHADYEPEEETCTVTSTEPRGLEQTFNLRKDYDPFNSLLTIDGVSPRVQSYGSEAVVTCLKDGDRVLTGGAAIAGRSWTLGPSLGVVLLMVAGFIQLRRAKKVNAPKGSTGRAAGQSPSAPKPRPPWRSPIVVVITGLAVLTIVVGVSCLVWIKTAGTLITREEPYLWDGKSDILVAHSGQGEPDDDTCTISAVDGQEPDVTFQRYTDTSWYAIDGRTLKAERYGYATSISCAQDGNRVLTGFGAVAGKVWAVSSLASIVLILAAAVVYMKHVQWFYIRRLFLGTSDEPLRLP